MPRSLSRAASARFRAVRLLNTGSKRACRAGDGTERAETGSRGSVRWRNGDTLAGLALDGNLAVRGDVTPGDAGETVRAREAARGEVVEEVALLLWVFPGEAARKTDRVGDSRALAGEKRSAAAVEAPRPRAKSATRQRPGGLGVPWTRCGMRERRLTGKLDDRQPKV